MRNLVALVALSVLLLSVGQWAIATEAEVEGINADGATVDQYLPAGQGEQADFATYELPWDQIRPAPDRDGAMVESVSPVSPISPGLTGE